MNLKWFTYGRKYAGKGYSKQHRGFMQQSNKQKHAESKLGRERVGSGLGRPDRLGQHGLWVKYPVRLD